eukprot:TRINITY_DN3157_c0_g2_i2.p1 TRINITY_DN3157_c0_g2~~TRINITY_DN3157_c0_g2_i2.p1  ORF type:complete len:528 (+),score=75.80 TRINITY_DN3157_c0_g2_i2:49-1632(+)
MCVMCFTCRRLRKAPVHLHIHTHARTHTDNTKHTRILTCSPCLLLSNNNKHMQHTHGAALPDWLANSDWADLFRCCDSSVPGYAAERPVVTRADLKEAFVTLGQEPREMDVVMQQRRTEQELLRTEEGYREWACYLSNILEARWRVDRAAVEAALPLPVSSRCTPADVAAIAEIRRVMIISDCLEPLSSDQRSDLVSEYTTGWDIIPLSNQWNRPPMLLMKEILNVCANVPADSMTFRVWRNPEKFLGNNRDIRQVFACVQRDTVASPELRWEAKERLQMAEQVIVRWLQRAELRFWCRHQLPESIHRPFVLLLDRLRVNGSAVAWVELFDVYGLKGSKVTRAIDFRVSVLENLWGPGLVLFLSGHSPGLDRQWKSSVAADPKLLSPELEELLSQVHTARLSQLRETLRTDLARLFDDQTEAGHYTDHNAPLPSAPAPRARPLKRGAQSEDYDPTQAGGAAKVRRLGKGSRAASASFRGVFKQIWDPTQRELERIRAAGLPEAPPPPPPPPPPYTPPPAAATKTEYF